jgi:hypothetical protein
MITGDYLQIPETGDRGTTFCPAISQNFTILDGHTHDGSNSEQIAAKSVTKGSVTLLAAAWASDSGEYKQTLTLPSGYLADTTVLRFTVNNGSLSGNICYPTVKKASANTFDVWIWDNTVELKVVVA